MPFASYFLQVIMSFLLDYPLGKKVRGHIEFFVSQLNFELQTGRESTLEMLATIFSSFPQVRTLSLVPLTFT